MTLRPLKQFTVGALKSLLRCVRLVSGVVSRSLERVCFHLSPYFLSSQSCIRGGVAKNKPKLTQHILFLKLFVVYGGCNYQTKFSYMLNRLRGGKNP